jgi:hypothetical protein
MLQKHGVNFENLTAPNLTPQTCEAGFAVAEAAAAPRKESNPLAGPPPPGTDPAAASCSSRKRSSGTRRAPCAQTIANPTSKDCIIRDARGVKKRRKKEKPERTTRISRLENWRPRRMSGGESAVREM